MRRPAPAFEGTGRWGHRALYITVYGDLTINAVSTLDSTMGAGGGKGIIVFGNWTNRGNFVANTYAVSFEGTNQTISGKAHEKKFGRLERDRFLPRQFFAAPFLHHVW